MTNFFQKIYFYFVLYPYYKMRLGQLGHASKFQRCTFNGHSRIFIGNKVFIRMLGWLAAEPVTGSSSCKLQIGDGTYIGRFCHIYASSEIIIGKKVLMADKVYISDNLHSFEDIHVPVIDQPVKQTSPVHIGDGAWLGENVSVIGASVGKQSVIGAHAVVTKNIPDYCVAVGIPAKIIKRYDFDTNKWRATDLNGNFAD